MSFVVIVWDECSLNNKYVFGFVSHSGVEILKHDRKIMLMPQKTLEKNKNTA